MTDFDTVQSSLSKVQSDVGSLLASAFDDTHPDAKNTQKSYTAWIASTPVIDSTISVATVQSWIDSGSSILSDLASSCPDFADAANSYKASMPSASTLMGVPEASTTWPYYAAFAIGMWLYINRKG